MVQARFHANVCLNGDLGHPEDNAMASALYCTEHLSLLALFHS